MTPFPGTLTTQIVEHYFTTKTGRDGCQRSHTIVLTPEQKAWFVRWFPTTENDRLMQASGMRFGTLHRLARQLGLKKSAKGLHGIMVRHGARVKKKLTESGFYDTLRGIAPSDACREAGKQYWQEVKEGKRPSPMRSLKAKDPKRYRQLMQKRGEYRKELMRRERLRLKYGLPLQSRLRTIRLQNYSKSQVQRRYNAIRRGYILMTDCSEQGGERFNIYYDASTTRSPRFEQNCQADGFHIKPLPKKKKQHREILPCVW